MENNLAENEVLEKVKKIELSVMYSWIGVCDCVTTIRGGGTGSDAWVAKILGEDEKWEFNRKFVRKDISGASRSMRSGKLRWDIDEEGIYEFRNFSNGCNYTCSGYFEIKDSEVTKINKREVKKKLKNN